MYIENTIHKLNETRSGSHEAKQHMYIEIVWNLALTRQSNDVDGNHFELDEIMLVFNETEVFLDLWQSTRSQRQTVSWHVGGRLICELDSSPRRLM